MSREFRASGNFTAQKRSDDGQQWLLNTSRRTSIVRDLIGAANGPLPGSLLVPITSAGLDVDLSLLTAPGPCFLHHQGLADGTDPGTNRMQNYVDIGIRDAPTGLVRAARTDFEHLLDRLCLLQAELFNKADRIQRVLAASNSGILLGRILVGIQPTNVSDARRTSKDQAGLSIHIPARTHRAFNMLGGTIPG